ncbi:hypothetical protein D3C80_1842510 [compost metagenome]
MDNDSMIVWLMPAMMEGKAFGNWTFSNSCEGVQPKARPASINSACTWRIPRFVKRTTGGMEKMTVAIVPGTAPRPKNMAAGIR